jgi:hypothetical protein
MSASSLPTLTGACASMSRVSGWSCCASESAPTAQVRRSSRHGQGRSRGNPRYDQPTNRLNRSPDRRWPTCKSGESCFMRIRLFGSDTGVRDYFPLLRWMIFTGVTVFGFALAWYYGLYSSCRRTSTPMPCCRSDTPWDGSGQSAVSLSLMSPTKIGGARLTPIRGRFRRAKSKCFRITRCVSSCTAATYRPCRLPDAGMAADTSNCRSVARSTSARAKVTITRAAVSSLAILARADEVIE